DGRIDCEDLAVLADHWGGAPAAAAMLAIADAASREAGARERVEVQAPSLVEAGDEFAVTLAMTAAGRVQGLSAQLAWDASVVQPLGVPRSAWGAGPHRRGVSPGPRGLGAPP